MSRRSLLVLPVLALCASSAHAESRTVGHWSGPIAGPRSTSLRPQLQVDGGLSIIGIGYEHPIASQIALQIEAGVFGTYFLPWFDLGDRVVGGVGGLRATWFARPSGRGLYVTPYVRAGYASGDHDEQEDMHGSGLALTAGAFVGWAFRLTEKLDLRAGLGGQYIYIDGDNDLGASTPFGAIDFTLGYSL